MPDELIPKDVYSEGSALCIRWSDGHLSKYPYRYLRYHCMCAQCVNEWTRERTVILDSIPQDIKPLKADYVGRYALQFHWSDGHDTGIYTFEHLRSICQCAECVGGSLSLEGRGTVRG